MPRQAKPPTWDADLISDNYIRRRANEVAKGWATREVVISASIADAFYEARNAGQTMGTAANTASSMVLRIIDALSVAEGEDGTDA